MRCLHKGKQYHIYYYGRKETERYGHRDVPVQCALLDVQPL